MAKINDELLDHEYDGIQEYDNPLPPWWVMLFYITIIFAVVYIPYYHILGMGDLSQAEYENEMAAAAAAKEAYAASQPAPSAASAAAPVAELSAEEALARGKELYDGAGLCFSCHKNDGGGMIGPDLTDACWYHSTGDEAGVAGTIAAGVMDKGMPPKGGSSITDAEVTYVAQYVLSLGGTNPEGALASDATRCQ